MLFRLTLRILQVSLDDLYKFVETVCTSWPVELKMQGISRLCLTMRMTFLLSRSNRTSKHTLQKSSGVSIWWLQMYLLPCSGMADMF